MIFPLSPIQKKHPGIQLPGGVHLYFSRPLVMSVVNCTPDSFFPPSRSVRPEEAAERALAAESQGADIIDFGAESSRPGAVFIDEEEEIRRLIPVLKHFRRQSALPVSADTRKAAVASMALDEGADIINDITALADPAMLCLCAERRAAVVLMHAPPGDMHTMGVSSPEEVRRFFMEAAEKAEAGGICRDRIILDPGFGFGKSTTDNLVLLNQLARIRLDDYPVLVGLSRKRFIGEITGREPEGRLSGTIAAQTMALLGGADIIRVHDTSEALDMVKVIAAFSETFINFDGAGE